MPKNIKDDEIILTECDNGEMKLTLQIPTHLYESIKKKADEKQINVNEFIQQELLLFIQDEEAFVENLHKEINNQLNEDI